MTIGTKKNEPLTFGMRRFRHSIQVIYKLMIKIVSLSGDSEAETAHTAALCQQAREATLTRFLSLQ